MKVLVTGASGFIGSAFCSSVFDRGIFIRASSRVPRSSTPNIQYVLTPSDDGYSDWDSILDNIDCILHLSGRAHVMRETHSDPIALFRSINVQSSLVLAARALKCGVKRFVYVSTIKVNGETTNGKPFRFDDLPQPSDCYSLSKLEAEAALLAFGRKTGLEVVIIRPPLVYGPGVKGNLQILVECLQKGIPLPLASAVYNRRTLVYIQNLVDLLYLAVSHPAATNEIFLVGDSSPISTVELIRLMGVSMGCDARLFHVHPRLFRAGARMLNKEFLYDRLFCSLELDTAHTADLLGWTPRYSVQEGMALSF